MKKFFTIFTYFIMGIVFSIKAQTVTIKAQILDSKNVSIPFATAVVLQTDSTIIEQALSTAEGILEMSISRKGEFTLRISSVGFEAQQQTLSIDGSKKTIDLGKIKLQEQINELGEVKVIEQKKLITVEADKISYNTEADPDTKTATALEMLRRVPMVTVDGEDNIQLKGNSNFKIFLDGKPSMMLTNNPAEFLKSFPATNIKNIEVITSPGAKYDAEGIGGIINIVTFKKLLSGYTCTLRGGADNVGTYNFGTYYAATIKKFAFSINLSGHYRNMDALKNTLYRENFDNETEHFSNSLGFNDNSGMFSWGSGELSYEIDTLNLISASFSLHAGTNKSDNQTTMTVTDLNQQIAQEYLTTGIYQFSHVAPEGNIDFQHTFKKNKKQLLTFSYKFGLQNTKQDNEQSIDPIVNFFSSKNKIERDEKNDEHTFQIDYVQPLKKQATLEMGAKNIYRINTSNASGIVYDFDLEAFVADPSQDIDFDYTQNIVALYTSFNQTIKKFGYKAGLRIENSQTNGIFSFSQENNFKNTNLEYVPSVNFSYQMNMKNSLQLSYSKRIQRPGIWYLNPYIDNLDPKNISYGNPKLNPEHYHSINLNYNAFLKKGNLNLSSYYSFANNGIEEITWIVGDVAYSTYQNVKKIQTLGFSVSFNYNFTKKFSFNTNTSATYNRLENTTDAGQKVESWGWNGFSRMQYTFEKDIKLSAYGGYYISAAGLQIQQGRFFYSGISISKEFFNKKMSFSLRAQNVFWKDMKWSSEINAQTYYQLSEHYRPGRSFGINLSYRFGEMNTQVKKSRRGINNDDLNQGGDQNNMNN